MIHALLDNGQTMLFDPDEEVWVTNKRHPHSYDVTRGLAWQVIEPGRFYIPDCSIHQLPLKLPIKLPLPLKLSKNLRIKSVRTV